MIFIPLHEAANYKLEKKNRVTPVVGGVAAGTVAGTGLGARSAYNRYKNHPDVVKAISDIKGLKNYNPADTARVAANKFGETVKSGVKDAAKNLTPWKTVKSVATQQGRATAAPKVANAASGIFKQGQDAAVKHGYAHFMKNVAPVRDSAKKLAMAGAHGFRMARKGGKIGAAVGLAAGGAMAIKRQIDRGKTNKLETYINKKYRRSEKIDRIKNRIKGVFNR